MLKLLRTFGCTMTSKASDLAQYEVTKCRQFPQMSARTTIMPYVHPCTSIYIHIAKLELVHP